MATAVSRNSTTAPARNRLDAKALIAAHRAAVARAEAIDTTGRRHEYPPTPSVTLTEIGPGCSVSTLERLDDMAREHINNQVLTYEAKLSFQRQIANYRAALKLMLEAKEMWRQNNNLDATEAADYETLATVEKTWKALLARIKSHPRDIPDIARYLAAEEVTGRDMWRAREALRLIGLYGKAVRQ